jgi:hypothetical protein
VTLSPKCIIGQLFGVDLTQAILAEGGDRTFSSFRNDTGLWGPARVRNLLVKTPYKKAYRSDLFRHGLMPCGTSAASRN